MQALKKWRTRLTENLSPVQYHDAEESYQQGNDECWRIGGKRRVWCQAYTQSCRAGIYLAFMNKFIHAANSWASAQTTGINAVVIAYSAIWLDCTHSCSGTNPRLDSSPSSTCEGLASIGRLCFTVCHLYYGKLTKMHVCNTRWYVELNELTVRILYFFPKNFNWPN